HFYRVTTQFLFHDLISYLNLTQPKLDALVLLTIVTLTLIRYQFKTAPEFIILDIGYWFFISREIIKSSSELSFHPVIATIFVVGCSAVLPLIFSRLKTNQGALAYHRASISLIFTFISVCIVAAISNALAKIFA